jgi:purine-cytosine permease-like protein
LRWTRWKLAVVLGIPSSLLAAWGILERLDLFLSLLAVAVSPIGGIIITDYYVLNRKDDSSSGQKWNPTAFGAYGLSFIIGWTTSGHPFRISIFPFSIFAFNGIIAASLLYWFGMKLTQKLRRTKRPAPDK